MTNEELNKNLKLISQFILPGNELYISPEATGDYHFNIESLSRLYTKVVKHFEKEGCDISPSLYNYFSNAINFWCDVKINECYKACVQYIKQWNKYQEYEIRRRKTFNDTKEIIEAVLQRVKQDIEIGDLTAIDRLLELLIKNDDNIKWLFGYLSEETQNQLLSRNL